MNGKRVLIACEESQTVTKAFRNIGVKAFSCDVEPCSGGHPEWHLRNDIFDIIKEAWDLIIAFPPCTHLSRAGAMFWPEKKSDGRLKEAIDFFMKITRSTCRYMAIENPVGIMSTVWRKPDQVIQPYFFGDPYSKQTCLWLKNLPPLRPTKIVDKGKYITFPGGKSLPEWYSRVGWLPAEERRKIRSKTFPGIAAAMAEQWAKYLHRNFKLAYEQLKIEYA